LSSTLIHIVSAGLAPERLPLLREWLLAEWDDLDPFEDPSEPPTLPAPLLAIDGSELVGGLMFSRFREPESDQPGLWINAVLVRPDRRRQGIASALIRSAQAEAAEWQHARIFALTDLPALYLKLGWRRIETGPNGTVVGASTPVSR